MSESAFFPSRFDQTKLFALCEFVRGFQLSQELNCQPNFHKTRFASNSDQFFLITSLTNVFLTFKTFIFGLNFAELIHIFTDIFHFALAHSLEIDVNVLSRRKISWLKFFKLEDFFLLEQENAGADVSDGGKPNYEVLTIAMDDEDSNGGTASRILRYGIVGKKTAAQGILTERGMV